MTTDTDVTTAEVPEPQPATEQPTPKKPWWRRDVRGLLHLWLVSVFWAFFIGGFWRAEVQHAAFLNLGHDLASSLACTTYVE